MDLKMEVDQHSDATTWNTTSKKLSKG